ncbi:hypothetical protein CIT25_34105 [Mesorhizobium mediterraneum]|uniref:Uncharacterized protein n=1 Tax=Mesorhizobium mediterraneum TaxID=43617 RepID=A0AB36QZ31_9HYPH|nr:hypothetical protein CIT25_34105 [Mesorhizobium mediterraneum]
MFPLALVIIVTLSILVPEFGYLPIRMSFSVQAPRLTGIQAGSPSNAILDVQDRDQGRFAR